mgnify:CR=1 FL=1
MTFRERRLSHTMSRRAKAQPRGKDGRFMTKKVTMVADEVGDMSKTNISKSGRATSSKTFSYGISAIPESKKKEFVDISADYKNKMAVKKEFKARKLNYQRRYAIAEKIGGCGVETYGYTIDKLSGVPNGWENDDRDAVQIATLKKSLEKTVKNTNASKIDVVIDDHKAYHGLLRNHAKRIIREIDKKRDGKKVTGGTYDSAYGRNSGLIETNDIVAHGVYRYAELEDETMVRLTGTKVTRLDSSETLEVKKRPTLRRRSRHE